MVMFHCYGSSPEGKSSEICLLFEQVQQVLCIFATTRVTRDLLNMNLGFQWNKKAAWWCNVPILKNDGVRQWLPDYPIYYGK